MKKHHRKGRTAKVRPEENLPESEDFGEEAGSFSQFVPDDDDDTGEDDLPGWYGPAWRTADKVSRALLAMQRKSWEQGTAMQAYLELGDFETLIPMAFDAVSRMLPDGRPACLSEGEGGIVDPCSAGEALLAAARETKNPVLIDAEKRLRSWALEEAPRNRDGIVYHQMHSEEFWSDSIYMLPPYLAAAGFPEEAVRQWWGYTQALFIPEKGLLAHRFCDRTESLSDPSLWGVGNGWALMGTARLIGLLPRKNPARREMIDFEQRLIDTVYQCRDGKGRFHNVLDQPDTFPEYGIASMWCYAVYRGLREKWLESDRASQRYRKYRQNAWELLRQVIKKVDRYGILREVCASPDFSHSGFAPEQQAVCLMAVHAGNQCLEDL